MSALRDYIIRMADGRRFLSREECEVLVQRIRGYATGGGSTNIFIRSAWDGELRWARNRASLASDRLTLVINVTREVLPGAIGGATTNQVDDVSLAAAVRAAERGARGLPFYFNDIAPPPPTFEYPKTAIWSDATYDLTTEERGRLARTLVESAEAEEMLSAGYLEISAQGTAVAEEERPLLYAAETQAQCSMTVRDSKGTGSGWAGLSSYDWGAIDTGVLAKRALEKALASRNPVTLEPGRYTVILEPQAVAALVDLIQPWVGGGSARITAEQGRGPFASGFDSALGLGRSKLGLKVVDERVTLSFDPMDPKLGVVPFVVEGNGHVPARSVKWIDHGVLTMLSYDRRYALSELNDNQGCPASSAYRMSGGPTSMDEMIRTTKRGLLVTRFSNIRPLDPVSLLATGLTRDGLWLIENGKISKAVKNLRFTESPLFVLNSLEQLGEPVPVFSPGTPVIVPPLKARDFSFTSVIDAV